MVKKNAMSAGPLTFQLLHQTMCFRMVSVSDQCLAGHELIMSQIDKMGKQNYQNAWCEIINRNDIQICPGLELKSKNVTIIAKP